MVFGSSRNATNGHVTGLYFTKPLNQWHLERHYLPQLDLSVHTHIVGSSSRTILTQTYANPSADEGIKELRYSFPLYDGVSVVGFVCTIGDRVIRGVVKEKSQARKVYQEAVDRGKTAGLLEQLPDASDVFTTTVGNVPAGATLKVEITYLGELKNDAGVDGIRYTIPTSVAPRYGDFPGTLLDAPQAHTKSGIQITIDVETPKGSNIKSIESPSHPISVTIGNTSSGAAAGTDMSLQKASATLALGTAELEKDFILQVVATNSGNPVALLETHPDIPQQRALMATLVPKFNLPSIRPEIVFVCDRSGSMGGSRIEGLKSALRIFLKSIPVGAKFNICSFGSRHEFLFPEGSRSYDQETLRRGMEYADCMHADFGGTEMYRPLKATFEKRYKDMDLEVFLLTDGEIWQQERLFTMTNEKVSESNGAIRLFTLGIGNDVSHALIEGVARAGNGFAQSVTDDEKMNAKVIRMLKAGLTPHVKDYTLEVKYGKDPDEVETNDDFEVVEKVHDSLSIRLAEDKTSAGVEKPTEPVKPISLFNPSADPDIEMTDADADTSHGGKYSHVPSVPEPKILQAPFTIPPLYPWIRTNVYLLLSPGTTQKTPKSVVLRATSVHGPLELEIPVAVLREKGQTIHQLAARKAVQELEHGRGWLYHAKDTNDPEQKLLKDMYEGRFSDMVEREAVRLGVTFQVGNKWCSYVAVEDKDQTETEVKPQQVARTSADDGFDLASESDSDSGDLHVQSRSRGGANRFLCASSSSESSAVGEPVVARARMRGRGKATRVAAFAAKSSSPDLDLYGAQPQAATYSALASVPDLERRGKSDYSSFSIPPSRMYSLPAHRPPPPTLCCAQSPSDVYLSVARTLGNSEHVPFPSALDSKDLLPLDSFDYHFLSPTPDPDSDHVVPPTASRRYSSYKIPSGTSPLPVLPSDVRCGSASATPGSTSGLFGAQPAPPHLMQSLGLARPLEKQQALSRSRGLFDAAPSNASPGSGLFGGPSSTAVGGVTNLFAGAAPGGMKAENLFGSSVVYNTGEPSSAQFSFSVSKHLTNPTAPAEVKPETVTPLDRLEAIVDLQHFDGSWSWSQQLLNVLGQGQSTEDSYGVTTPNNNKNLLATALVLAFLEAKLADEKDEWEMLADKAREWLRSELSSSDQKGLLSVEEYVEKLKASF